jgi:acyl-coenzyme A thioesterase PaaI-like protein
LHGCDAASEPPDFAWLIRTAPSNRHNTIQGGMLAAMLDSATATLSWPAFHMIERR